MLETGRKYGCIRDVVMDTGEKTFLSGSKYKAVDEKTLINENGREHVVIDALGEFFKRHFDPEPLPEKEKYVKQEKKVKDSITEEALRLIGGDRQEDYGDVRTSFDSIAKVWSGILKTDVTGEQVALMMVGLKLVRQSNKHKRDNLVDCIGYTILLARLEGEE